MAFNYAQVKANIVQWVQDVAGEYLYPGQDGAGAVWWLEDAWDYQVTPYVELTWNDAGRMGRDQVRWDPTDGDEDTMTPTMIGARRVRVLVQVRARDDVDAPRNVIEALREDFDNEISAINLRQNYGIAPITIERAEVSGFDWEGIRESVGEIEFIFGYQTTSTPKVTIERIRNVEFRNQVRDIEGNVVGENVPVIVGLDFPPGDAPPAFRSAFTTAFSVLEFGAGPSSDPSTSPFDPDMFDIGFEGIT